MLGYFAKITCRYNDKINVTRYIYRGFKMKHDKKKVQKKFTNTDRALEHFDLHYKPVYKGKWPSIRISLLTAKKTCAVMNNFAENSELIDDFKLKGANDIIEMAKARQTYRVTQDSYNVNVNDKTLQNQETFVNDSGTGDDYDKLSLEYNGETFDSKVDMDSSLSNDKLLNERADMDKQFTELNMVADTENKIQDTDRTDLYNFMPVETVYSETQNLRLEEAKRVVYTPLDVKVDIVKPRKIALPLDLKVMGFPSGNTTEFPNVKADKKDGMLCYFMMDAASILPVIALDLEEGDNVLDLCAAPGGKSLTILQTGLPGSVTCNDISGSRVKRLLDILHFYLPEKDRDHVTVTRRTGTSYDQPDYDKVLVDVPCNTDRHYLLDDINNLFSPSRITERIEMPTLQKDLLMSGIMSCRPGGCIVYSTCTLSPAQNDGVIQDTLDNLWRNTNIDVVVEDLEEITHIFKDSFKFYKKCRFGQLVIPSLSLNYGPMYFCRLRRIS